MALVSDGFAGGFRAGSVGGVTFQGARGGKVVAKRRGWRAGGLNTAVSGEMQHVPGYRASDGTWIRDQELIPHAVLFRDLAAGLAGLGSAGVFAWGCYADMCRLTSVENMIVRGRYFFIREGALFGATGEMMVWRQFTGAGLSKMLFSRLIPGIAGSLGIGFMVGGAIMLGWNVVQSPEVVGKDVYCWLDLDDRYKAGHKVSVGPYFLGELGGETGEREVRQSLCKKVLSRLGSGTTGAWHIQMFDQGEKKVLRTWNGTFLVP